MYRSLSDMNGEPTVNIFLRRVLKPGMTFFDCGANVGWLTTVGSRLVGPKGIVVAFEPGPPVHALADSLRSDLCFNTTIVPAAVSDRDGTAKFQIGEDHVVGRLADEGITVPSLTLDAYAAANDLYPNVIKLDIEGQEAAAIRGARRLIAERAPIIIFEQTREDLTAIDLLRTHGYQIINIHDYSPCNYASQFKGHLQNLAAWKPSAHFNLSFSRERLTDVRFLQTPDGYDAPLELDGGLYVFTTHLPSIQDHASYRVWSEHEGVFSSDAPLTWLSLSYGSMPWFTNFYPSRPVVQLITKAKIDLPPLVVERLVPTK